MTRSGRPTSARISSCLDCTSLMTLFRIVCIACVFLVFTACSDPPPHLPPPPENTYRIYSSYSTKGSAAGLSQQIVRAIDLAIQQYSSNDLSIRIEHIKLDGSFEETGDWSPVAEMKNARLASNDPIALAYIGPYSSGGAATSLPITNRAGLLQIGISHTWPGLTVPGWDVGEPDRYRPSVRQNYVRMSVPDSRQAEAAAQWARDLGIRTMVTLDDGSTYSQGLSNWFEVAARDIGISITRTIKLELDGLEGVATELRKLDPDALFYAPSTTSQAAMLAKAVEGIKPRMVIFATDTALDDRFLTSAHSAVGLWQVVTNSTIELPTLPQANLFRNDYKAAYGDEPGLYAATAYDATKLILGAIGSGKVERKNIIEAVRTTVAYPGVSGLVSFDEHGDRRGWRISGYRVEDGYFALDRLFDSSP